MVDLAVNSDKQALEMLVRTLGSTPLYYSYTGFMDIWDNAYAVEEIRNNEEVVLYWDDNEVMLENAVMSFGQTSSEQQALSSAIQIAQLIAERGEPNKISYQHTNLEKKKPIAEIPYEDGAPDNFDFDTITDKFVEGTFAFSAVYDTVFQTLSSLAQSKGVPYEGSSVTDLATKISMHDNASVIELFLKRIDKAPFSFYESGFDESERYQRESVSLVWEGGTRELDQTGYRHEWNVMSDPDNCADSMRVQINRLITELGEPLQIRYSLVKGGKAGNSSDGPDPEYNNMSVTIKFSEVKGEILSE